MNAERGLAALMLLLTLVAARVAGQPSERASYVLHTGTHDNHDTDFVVGSVHTVDVPDAPWLRVHVDDFNLGKRSRVVFTSLEDGYWQRHDAQTLAQWGGWSAFFNGEAVAVELHIAPGDTEVFAEIDEILIGKRGDTIEGEVVAPRGRGPCDEDNRVPSEAKRICRFIDGDNNDPDARCTGWIIANGALLTAGHCDPIIDPGCPIAEFDIPASDCDGTVNFGDPDHQYAVNLGSIESENDGIGNDWAILSVYRNPNTGLMPAYGEDAFVRVGRDLDIIDPDTVRITGCGKDDDPAGCTGDYNSDHRTLQTRTGDFVREDSDADGTWLEYDLYVRQGDSGSPSIDTAWNLGIGIVTHRNPNCPTYGTSFNHNPLQRAVNTFPHPDTVYVDQGHPILLQTGKIFSPWLLLDPALADVAGGGLVNVVEGEYFVSSGEVNQHVTITAPVGSVVIRGPE